MLACRPLTNGRNGVLDHIIIDHFVTFRAPLRSGPRPKGNLPHLAPLGDPDGEIC